MSRNYGIMSGRPDLGGTSDGPPTSDAKQYYRADSNVIYFPPSAARDPRATDDDDQSFAALCFAMAALASPFAFFGCAVTIWLLFF